MAFRYNAREQGHCTLPAASSHLHAVHVHFVRTGVQLLYNMWHSGINATSVDRSALNYFNAQLPLRCAMVMKVVHAQLYNACQWYRMTSTWTRTTPRDGEGGTGNGVPPAWKGFVPFKASAQDVTCYTDFFDRVAYAAEWSTRYSVSEAERSPGSRAGSSPAGRSPSGRPATVACAGGAAAAQAATGAGGSTSCGSTSPSAGASSVATPNACGGGPAGAMYSAYTGDHALNGPDKYYLSTVAEVAAAEKARDSVGWKWRWYSEGSHHANVIRCVGACVRSTSLWGRCCAVA